MAWSPKMLLLVAAVVLALAGAVWALGDPAPNPGGPGALPPGARDPGRHVTLPTPDADAGLRTPSAAPGEPVTIAPGVTLRPGVDATLPVSVRWVRQLSAPETIAVQGDTVYAADVAFSAFDLADGTLRWRAVEPSGEGFDADGGVLIGSQGTDQVRVWAPFNYDLTVDGASGHIDRLRRGGEVSPQGFLPFAAPRSTAYRLHHDLTGVVARSPGGEVAWRISVDSPEYDETRPIAVPGGMVLLLSSGDLVALDLPRPS
jgi:hypothetical protein